MKRVLDTFPIRVVKRYMAANGGNWATVVAWNMLFAFFPITLVAITILGFALSGMGAGNSLEAEITKAFPGGQGQQVVEALHHFRTAAGPLAIVSLVGLLWSGSALFGAIDQGLNALHPCKSRDFIPQKLMAFGMIFVMTLLLIPAVASSSLLSVLHQLPDVPNWLSGGPGGLILQLVGGLVVGTLLFGAIYWIVPNRHQPVRQVLPGAITGAVMFEAFTLLFPLYFKLNHGFSTWGQTFALFFLVLTYAYFMAQIVMLAGAVNAELHPPEPGAWPVEGGGLAPSEGREVRMTGEPSRERAAAVTPGRQ